MYANPIHVTMSLYIHVESPKGMQFALTYEICELNISKNWKAHYQCVHNSSIHAYKAVQGGCLSRCITTYWLKY